MKYRHTDNDRYAIYENLMVDICARLYEPSKNNTHLVHSDWHRKAYQQIVSDVVQGMPLAQGGPEFVYAELPDTTKMYHENARGHVVYNELISDLMWRAELYRRGETFADHTKGIDDISWRILAATGAALADYEEGSALGNHIDSIDLPASILKGDQATRSDVLRVLHLQHQYSAELEEYLVTNPYPNDIEQVLTTITHGRAVAQAGIVDDDLHLIMRVEDDNFTLYKGVSAAAAQGMTGRPFRDLVEHPLFHGLDLTIHGVETQPDRVIIQLEGNQMKSLQWREKDDV